VSSASLISITSPVSVVFGFGRTGAFAGAEGMIPTEEIPGRGRPGL